MFPDHRLKVLIADASESIRTLLTLLLEREFEVVGAARNGREAFALAAQERPDVVLADSSLPGTDGVETTGLIRRRFPLIQIVLMSEDGSPELAGRARDAGASEVLFKATDLWNVRSVIANLGALGLEQRLCPAV